MRDAYLDGIMAKVNQKDSYSADDIGVLEGLEPVRKTPGMYIGSTDSYGLYQMAKELLDNGRDEYLAGANKIIGCALELLASGREAIWVWDAGRGIPVEKHPKTKRSTLETVFCTLHAGAKFSDKTDRAYAKSAGVHGVGASVVNALSSVLQVWTYRKGICYTQIYRVGAPTAAVKKVAKPPAIPGGYKMQRRGTLIRYIPDPTIFKKKLTPFERVFELMDLSAYLHPKAKFMLYCDDNMDEFYQPDGPKALVQRLIAKAKAEPFGKPLIVETESVHAALQWSSHTDEDVHSYVSGSVTVDGGTHIVGLYRAIMEAIEPYRGKAEFSSKDIRSFLHGVINVDLSRPHFIGQTKTKLASPEGGQLVLHAMLAALKEYFASNKSNAKAIVQRAANINAARNHFEDAKQIDAKLRAVLRGGRLNLPPKLSAHVGNAKPHEIELFLVEGDSAGGTAKQARDRAYQEVLPLRGKTLNTLKANDIKIARNPEVQGILLSLGYENYMKKGDAGLRVGRIILLADPDEDGSHINVLFLAILQKLVPNLIKSGKVFAVNAPLYTATHRGVRYMANSLAEIEGKLPKGAPNNIISRFKGWGEMNPQELRPLVFDPATRELYKIEAVNGAKLQRTLDIVGGKPEVRRELLGL